MSSSNSIFLNTFYLIWSFRPTFKREKQLHKRLLVIKKNRCKRKLNKTTHIGARILERIIELMYDFQYNYNV